MLTIAEGETLATRRCPLCAWVGTPDASDDETVIKCPECGHGTVAYEIRLL